MRTGYQKMKGRVSIASPNSWNRGGTSSKFSGDGFVAERQTTMSQSSV
ncbi:hypothetical protein SHI21_03365 [Bacteriovorax sp. PP10]|uniref:Uncharacterized protein n=1 Tax=Bacteriovorax antarcticus TaxID=3088717 RepID=A0ABU5VT78_9BACT|nr:hypothetical protein [Bacteriovorax sp. PP10]MEA9355220.1 hypothetical protein [Bacteriovorax sp. PP10]